jgi:hypothetical protein
MSDRDQLLRDLARAKAAFQLRSLEAVLCADARSKHDQETRRAPAQDGDQ